MKKFIFNSIEDMELRLKDIIRSSNQPIAIIGGHFALEKDFQPGIKEADSFGIFPKFTFDIACSLTNFAKQNSKNCKMTLIVDDHSLMEVKDWYLNQNKNDPYSIKIRKGVENYLKKFKIPEEYKEIMEKWELKKEDILKADKVIPFLESFYRKEFEKENPDIPVGCAGEYELILEELAKQEIKKVIAFIPLRCQGPTCFAINQYNLKNKKSLSIAHIYLTTDSSINSKKRIEEWMKKEGILFIAQY